MSRNFDARLEAAVRLAEQHSGFSNFHASYRPLFFSLWRRFDPAETGRITAEQAEEFAAAMVENGWGDWAPSDEDVERWRHMQAVHGAVVLEHFAEASENAAFEVPPREVNDDSALEQAQPVRAPRRQFETRAEAGRRMVEAQHARLATFEWPTNTKAASQMSPNHCVDCEHQPMCQHPYGSGCRVEGCTSGEELLDYQCCCRACSGQRNRCCGCGCNLA